VLQVQHAKVELARFQGEYGSATESFSYEGKILYHGSQIMEVFIAGYDPEVRFHQSSHTLSNIYKALEDVFIQPEETKLAKRALAEYILLDALVGNTDRHHENWGILVWHTGDQWQRTMAPSFDHASSLGRELLDETRIRLLHEGRVGNYAERGHGAIYWSSRDATGLSPLELLRRAARTYPCVFRLAKRSLVGLNKRVCQRIIERIPADWMRSAEREFVIALVCYNHARAHEIFQ